PAFWTVGRVNDWPGLAAPLLQFARGQQAPRLFRPTDQSRRPTAGGNRALRLPHLATRRAAALRRGIQSQRQSPPQAGPGARLFMAAGPWGRGPVGRADQSSLYGRHQSDVLGRASRRPEKLRPALHTIRTRGADAALALFGLSLRSRPGAAVRHRKRSPAHAEDGFFARGPARRGLPGADQCDDARRARAGLQGGRLVDAVILRHLVWIDRG